MNAPLKMLYRDAKGIMFSVVFSIWLMCCCLPSAEPLVVPQELPSILSLIYSNIPPIKKGTDSRLGFGFRLGNHADFQVLLELGPQKNTRPIGEDADSENSFNKRQVNKAHRDYLRRKQAQEAFKQLSSTLTTTTTTTEPTANNWLESWSNAMHANVKSDSKGDSASRKKSANPLKKQHQQQQLVKINSTPSANAPDQSMMQLQMLYQMATSSSSTTTSSTSAPPLELQAATETPVTIVTPVSQHQRLRPTFVPYKGGPLNLGGPFGFTPRPVEELALQILQQSEKKSKSEITKELMDVSLEAEGQ
uniref:Uncharacterized protein n=1 Tax=Ceratitis capitata TaxID=7213 RepID=W8B8U6_CERCA